jgi:hypothetical protein
MLPLILARSLGQWIAQLVRMSAVAQEARALSNARPIIQHSPAQTSIAVPIVGCRSRIKTQAATATKKPLIKSKHPARPLRHGAFTT